MTTKPAVRRTYTTEDKTRALTALIASGSPKAAQDATGIHEATIRSWRDTSERELYARISREHGDQLQDLMLAQSRGIVDKLSEAELKATERLIKNIDQLDKRDLPAAVKNITAAKTQNLDKYLVMSGRATERVEHVDARDLVAEIVSIARPYINSTATDETGNGA